MLTISDLTVTYGTGRHKLTAVDSASFSVPRGTTLALVGESGSGKSTIARAIVGLAPVSSGSIRVAGTDVDVSSSRRTPSFRRQAQMVFQDPFASLNPRMTVADTLDEALSRRGGLIRRDRRREAVRLLDLVRLPLSSLSRFPHEFSGGQRQRIAIARALSVGPEVILMDEVTSALDVSVQATIINLLKDLQSELALTYLFISHDLSVVSTISDRIAVLYLGRIVEQAETPDIISAPEHPYTKALMASVPGAPSAVQADAPLPGELPDPRNPPRGCPFHARCPVGPQAIPSRTICVTDDPRHIATQRLHSAACHYASSVQRPPSYGAPKSAAVTPPG